MRNRDDESLSLAMAKVLWHRKSLLTIISITLALSITTPDGFLRFNPNATASLIFQVAGPIVALALTAAGLSSTFTLKLAADMEMVYKDRKFPPESKAQAIINRAEELQDALLPAWRGTILVLSSFILSAVTLVTPPRSLPLGREDVRLTIDGLFASASLACLLVGTLAFIPTVRFSFRGKLLGNLLKAAQRTRDNNRLTVAKLLQRARELKSERPQDSYPQIQAILLLECQGRLFPILDEVALAEMKQTNAEIADATLGWTEIRQSIDTSSWEKVCKGIVLLLEHEETRKMLPDARKKIDLAY